MKRILSILAVVIAAASVGCTKKTGDAPGDKPAAAEREAAGAPATVDPALCEDHCRLLALHPLASLEGGLTETLCSGKRTVYQPDYCDGYEHDLHCIQAHHGQVFTDKKWRNTFARKSWYQPRDDFKESELSSVAMANIRELEERAAACRQAKIVTAEDQERVREWLKTKKLPAILAVWGERKGVDVFGPMLAEFDAGDKLIMRYMSEPESEENRAFLSAYEGQKLRHLSIEKDVCPSADEQAEESEDAEGEEEEEMECYNPVFFMTLDEAGQVIALWGTAAG